MSASALSTPTLGQVRIRQIGRVLRKYPVAQLVLTVLIYLIGMALLPGFGVGTSLGSILVISALAGIAALGQTVVFIIGGFDLSVAGFIALGAYFVTSAAALLSIDFILAALIALGLSAVLGAGVGWLCHKFELQPLIVTMAVGTLVLGLTTIVSSLSTTVNPVPTWLKEAVSPRSSSFGLPVPPLLIVWAAIAVVVSIALNRTSIGRRLFYTGSNPDAAELSLTNTRRVWSIAYGFSALASAFAGVFLVAFAGSPSSTMGNPYLFLSITAVVVGGTLIGGPGSYTRTIVGALLVSISATVLVGLGFTFADQQILYGVVILTAMALFGRGRRLRNRV